MIAIARLSIKLLTMYIGVMLFDLLPAYCSFTGAEFSETCGVDAEVALWPLTEMNRNKQNKLRKSDIRSNTAQSRLGLSLNSHSARATFQLFK